MAENTDMNGNLDIRVSEDTRQLDWTESPSGTVWRKRVHLVGPPESGQVTSIVRYLSESDFPPHDHPDGEEILVLEGVFSDEHGDWPGGTYLLNPEGFRHAPFSKPGCELLVKLRQYPGQERRHVAVNHHTLPWAPTGREGEGEKVLYSQTGFSDETRLLRWDPGSSFEEVDYAEGAEFFVIDGEFSDQQGNYSSGAWLRIPKGEKLKASTVRGCTLYCKTGGIDYLNSSFAN